MNIIIFDFFKNKNRKIIGNKKSNLRIGRNCYHSSNTDFVYHIITGISIDGKEGLVLVGHID